MIEYLGYPRNKDWADFRDAQINLRGSRCEISGASTCLEAHHILPFHICIEMGRPELEMDPNNIMILSEAPINYHLYIGHLGYYSSFNPYLFEKNKWRKLVTIPNLEESPDYLSYVKIRPSPLNKMKSQERMWLATFINTHFP